MDRDLGDFQTPPQLVNAVLACLYRGRRNNPWTRMIEPTCGSGNFINGALSLAFPPREIVGIELQERYIHEVNAHVTRWEPSQVTIEQKNIFEVNFGADIHWQGNGPLLVVGNPPWITNAELSILSSANVPRKRNLKHLSGYDAMTGSSNFDIAESIWLKLLQELASENPTIALLCKTTVARTVLTFAAAKGLPIRNAEVRRIDAKRWFQAAVDACLFVVEVGSGQGRYEADMYPHLLSSTPASTIGVIGGRIVSSVRDHTEFAHLDGASPLIWRQGVKHDAASVVELKIDNSGLLRNKCGEAVSVESAFIYPFLKSSDIGGSGKASDRAIIVTQTRIGEQTRHLAQSAPLLWSYLEAHAEAFNRRKSAIYRNQPQFAYFGIGEYTFAPYKVAISGMYKTPVFRAIGPIGSRPVLFDDTCYFLPCSSSLQAALIASLLNDPLCLRFLHSISFQDAKRPITKKLLQRIDLLALLRHVDHEALLRRAQTEVEHLTEETSPVLWPEPLERFLSDDETSAESGAVQLLLPIP